MGAFLQRTTNINDKNTLESGLRIDHTTDYGTFVLPRVSWLHRFNSRLSTRLGGGLGYKNPTVFTEKSEEINFRYVLPISPEDNAAERSVGANLDVNYLIPIGDEASLSINQLFFYTQINDPLILQPEPDMVFLKYNNVSGDVHTAGFETNIKANYKDFKLFAGYTFINARNHYEGMNTPIPLTPRSQVGVVLMYEIEGKLRAGFESYFTGKQYLMDESYSPSYWRFGFMGEKIWERFSIFINFENFTDTRQDKFSPIVGGSPNEPTFTQIWAPTDGFIVNGGFKIFLGE